MIESEILDIIKNVESQSERVGLIADQFRQGRKVGDLIELLNSDNQEVVAIGAWIASEIRIDPASAQPLISRLRELVNHEDPSIRFHAIGALFPHLDITDPVTKEMLTGLTCDPNEGVRSIAQAALQRLSRE